ncbi:MAG: phage tail protein I [Paracoccus sp. (in: a-proteobacteria)]|nr:phage tail protein I [Paracoccus sp. (in: a-proteobacteria)]
MTSLLPPNSTAAERAIEAATDRPVAVPVADLWSPERCPSALLPWLAWALSIDNWDADWSDEVKREVIAASVEVHRHKGTVWAMRRALTVAGLGDADIQEGWSARAHNAVLTFNGAANHQSSDHWAEYRVNLRRPMSIAQAALARAILTAAAPARCHIKHLSFAEAAHLHDAAISFDGQHTFGVV